MSDVAIKIGVGGLLNLELMTFDYVTGDKLKPYVSKIVGRDFKYGFKREFAPKKYVKLTKKPYGTRDMQLITFELEKHVAYEYKRFAGDTEGEIEEGYFVILSDGVKFIEYDELIHWCGTAKEKERRMKKEKEQQLKLGGENFAKDDIDF